MSQTQCHFLPLTSNNSDVTIMNQNCVKISWETVNFRCVWSPLDPTNLRCVINISNHIWNTSFYIRRLEWPSPMLILLYGLVFVRKRRHSCMSKSVVLKRIVRKRCGRDFESVISKHMLRIKSMNIFCKIAFSWMLYKTCVLILLSNECYRTLMMINHHWFS